MTDHATFGNTSLPQQLQFRVERELGREENLLWVGQPKPGRFMMPAFLITLFGIPFTLFALVWITMASGFFFVAGDADMDFPFSLFSLCFPLFGVPFVIVGFGLLTAPYWAWRKAKKTCYAVTDQRAIVWEAGFFGSINVRSYRDDTLASMQRTEHADGSGNLIFEEHYTYGHRGRRHLHRYGFFAIECVRDIEELIRRVLVDGRGNEQRNT